MRLLICIARSMLDGKDLYDGGTGVLDNLLQSISMTQDVYVCFCVVKNNGHTVSGCQ